MLQSPISKTFAKLEDLRHNGLSGKPLESLAILESLFEASRSFTGEFCEFVDNLLLLPFWQSQTYPDNPYPALCLEFASSIDSHFSLSKHLEPSYHSRKHFQDVCLALTALLAQPIEQPPKSNNLAPWRLSKQDAWVLLFCALAHDYEHDGSINQTPFELEKRSIAKTRLFLNRSEIDLSTKNHLSTQIEPIILATDPGCLTTLLNKFDSSTSEPTHTDCLCMLMVQADLLASALPVSGKILGQLLEKEWMVSNPVAAAAVASNLGRFRFLQHIRFIGPQAAMLNLEAIRKLSIEQSKD